MRRGISASLLAMIVLAGCGGGAAPLPSGQESRSALQDVLDAWKSGKKPAALTERKPPIEAVDHEWTAGKALEAFTIGEATEAQGNTTYVVTLNLKGASAPATVRYMVFGKEPIRVYRDDDFARMTNMQDGPAVPKPRR